MNIPEYDEGDVVQRRAEVLRAYADRPLGIPLRKFLKSINLKFSEWQRMMGNRAFRSNVLFADQERVRFSVQHVNDVVADVLDVQLNLALRGDGAAADRVMRISGLLGKDSRPGTLTDIDPALIESAARMEEQKPQTVEDAMAQEMESRESLDAMVASMTAETSQRPPDLRRTDGVVLDGDDDEVQQAG